MFVSSTFAFALLRRLSVLFLLVVSTKPQTKLCGKDLSLLVWRSLCLSSMFPAWVCLAKIIIMIIETKRQESNKLGAETNSRVAFIDENDTADCDDEDEHYHICTQAHLHISTFWQIL